MNEGTEAKPKRGYVARAPGAVLRLRISTAAPGGGAAAGAGAPSVALVLAYLKSYAHMGVATVACASGCACEPRRLDAHQEVRESTLHLASLRVSAAAVCEITVTVAEESSSPGGEHKFKVGGLMASWSGGGAPAYELRDGAWGMAGHHGQWPVRAGDNDDPERNKTAA